MVSAIGVHVVSSIWVDSRSCDSIGGCCDSRRGLCCTHFPCQEPELWTVIRPELAVRWRWALGSARRCHRQSLGRAIVPELRSCHRCQDGLILSPCPRSMSSSIGSGRSCRGAIVTLHAHARVEERGWYMCSAISQKRSEAHNMRNVNFIARQGMLEVHATRGPPRRRQEQHNKLHTHTLKETRRGQEERWPNMAWHTIVLCEMTSLGSTVGYAPACISASSVTETRRMQGGRHQAETTPSGGRLRLSSRSARLMLAGEGEAARARA
eukprot:scaffold3273_cov126-Isochrysis_galbana.AAC.4